MSTCARCGLEQGSWIDAEKCSAHQEDNSSGVIDCRNRELANLRALLRSVTERLEDVSDFISPGQTERDVAKARNIIYVVLEALS